MKINFITQPIKAIFAKKTPKSKTVKRRIAAIITTGLFIIACLIAVLFVLLVMQPKQTVTQVPTPQQTATPAQSSISISGTTKATSRLSNNLAWPLYNDDMNNFSFQFPPDWHQKKNEDNTLEPYRPIGGDGFVGVSVSVYENPNRQSVKEFLKEEAGKALYGFVNLLNRDDQFMPMKIDGHDAILDAFTPGADASKAIYIDNPSAQQIISVNCACDAATLHAITESFRFYTFRDSSDEK